jgi:hypothetical protein
MLLVASNPAITPHFCKKYCFVGSISQAFKVAYPDLALHCAAQIFE